MGDCQGDLMLLGIGVLIGIGIATLLWISHGGFVAVSPTQSMVDVSQLRSR